MLSDLCAEESEPLLRFDLAHANAALIEQQLIRREVDLGISTAPSTPGVASHLIGHQDNVVIVPQNHPWAHLESIPLSALDGQRFVAYSQDCVIRGYYDFILRSAHVEPDIFAESRVHGNILDMVSYGMGVSIVPRMKRLEERYDLLSLSIQDDIPPRAIYLLWAEGAALPQEVEEFRVRIIENTDLSRYL